MSPVDFPQKEALKVQQGGPSEGCVVENGGPRLLSTAKSSSAVRNDNEKAFPLASCPSCQARGLEL